MLCPDASNSMMSDSHAALRRRIRSYAPSPWIEKHFADTSIEYPIAYYSHVCLIELHFEFDAMTTAE